ncbi:hypothetical protein MTR67_034763 [Solanum verrucosum]|uniref:Uncharacterized protein n=1 Tax=Solanum verrucosum TaxID=315347 RepID=A0AAF0U8E0_SOLVR|nr:hypothetical protein MTR67_034763 [Solanum verrucosum]
MLVLRGSPLQPLPASSEKNWLRLDPQTDPRSVDQTTVRGLCPWIKTSFTQPLTRTMVDHHGPSFDPRSVGLTIDRSFTLSCMLSTFQVLTHTCATSSRDVGSDSATSSTSLGSTSPVTQKSKGRRFGERFDRKEVQEFYSTYGELVRKEKRKSNMFKLVDEDIMHDYIDFIKKKTVDDLKGLMAPLIPDVTLRLNLGLLIEQEMDMRAKQSHTSLPLLVLITKLGTQARVLMNEKMDVEFDLDAITVMVGPGEESQGATDVVKDLKADVVRLSKDLDRQKSKDLSMMFGTI